MTFTFVSNYINHHQLPVAKELFQKLGEDYVFIQTEPMEEERIAMGWGETEEMPFLHLYYEEEEFCKKKILDSDIVMFGGVDDESYIEPRLEQKKPVIRYAERFYKEGRWKAVSPRGLIKKYHDHTRYQKAPVYLLCAGAYVAGDYAIIRAYRDKCFEWGYFPEFIPYEDVFASKGQDHKIHILWAGRMIDWKHPELVIEVAKRLKAMKESLPPFEITMIGGGAMKEALQQMTAKEQLEDVITFAGFQTPKVTRTYMEKADFYLFTSDQKEGWGAVLNEAMNSGCVVIANEKIGAAPTLLEDEKNGFLYRGNQVEDMIKQMKSLMADTEGRRRIGLAAYHTMEKLWNPQCAATRLLAFAEAIQKEYEEKGATGQFSNAPKYFCLPEDGPLSRAKRR